MRFNDGATIGVHRHTCFNTLLDCVHVSLQTCMLQQPLRRQGGQEKLVTHIGIGPIYQHTCIGIVWSNTDDGGVFDSVVQILQLPLIQMHTHVCLY